jgi:hypothetical protein
MENKKLNPGNYMKVTPVRLFLAKYFPNIEMQANKLTKHEGEYDVYFNTSDLKSIMDLDLFKEMECQVTTHMILSESDKF